MFKRANLGVFSWFVLILVLSVPILNLIFLIWGFLTNKFSANVKNFIIAYIIAWFIFGFSAFQSGLL